MPRTAGRLPQQMRAVEIEPRVARNADGSCLIRFGHTHVLCTATIEDRLPFWLRGKGHGWVTAEYGMLPRATHERTPREAVRGKQTGRTQEIQRLIGRSLRAVTNLSLLRDHMIVVDCDVIQADGGTRTASITGGYVALRLALAHLVGRSNIPTVPLADHVAAVSCGIINGTKMLDLDYKEDSAADADANFVMTGSGQLVEVQATAEGALFSRKDFDELLDLAATGIAEIVKTQRDALDRMS